MGAAQMIGPLAVVCVRLGLASCALYQFRVIQRLSRAAPFNLLAQILVGSVGFHRPTGVVLVSEMNYTSLFPSVRPVSGLTTQIEARVPGKVTEVDVKDDSFVKKGEVLFRMDPQPYVDQLHHAQSAYAEAEIRTSTAILQTTQTVNSARGTSAKLWKAQM